MSSTLVLKIDGSNHVVHYTATEDNVVVHATQFHNAVSRDIPTVLKFNLQNAVAEILNGDVKVGNVNIKWLTVGE
jgi:hypothetical protein